MQVERRVADLEARASTLKTGRTPDQVRCVDRYVSLLVKQRPIPARLRQQFRRVPPEEPISPALQKMIDAVMNKTPALPVRNL